MVNFSVVYKNNMFTYLKLKTQYIIVVLFYAFDIITKSNNKINNIKNKMI